MPLLAAALPLLLAAATPQAAVAASLAAAGARAELGSVRTSSGAGCTAERWETLRAVSTSGAVPLRFDGRGADGTACQGYAWGRVKVLAAATVTTRPLAEGEPLEGATATEEREVLPGRRPLAAAPAGATAARRLAAGAQLDEDDVRTGPPPGRPVLVVLRAGSLSVEQAGRVVPCPRGRACALLPSGRRVEGRYADGHLLVESP